jgi:hypothetical protein
MLFFNSRGHKKKCEYTKVAKIYTATHRKREGIHNSPAAPVGTSSEVAWFSTSPQPLLLRLYIEGNLNNGTLSRKEPPPQGTEPYARRG